MIECTKPILIKMDHVKIGDYIVLTPILKEIELGLNFQVIFCIPNVLFELYNSEKVFKNIISNSDYKNNLDKYLSYQIIDLTFPHLIDRITDSKKANFYFLDKNFFSFQQHVYYSYLEALKKYFPFLNKNHKPTSFLDISIDHQLLNKFNLKPMLYFTVHAGSDFKPKNWPNENYEVVIVKLLQKFRNLRCVSLVGPSDESLFQDKTRLGDLVLRFVEIQSSFYDAGKIMASSLLHLDNDSGIHHLAGALDVPTISIWGPTGPGTWKSISDLNTVIWGGPYCNDHCGSKRADSCTDRVCLNRIMPSEVEKKAIEILNQYDFSKIDDLS